MIKDIVMEVNCSRIHKSISKKYTLVKKLQRYSRRETLKEIIVTMGMLILNPRVFAETPIRKSTKDISYKLNLYRAVNGTPDTNLVKVVEEMGGIEKIIGSDDIVVIKPNVQWWNHGASNLSALKAFVDLIMDLPGGFCGEVVVADNCHRGNTQALHQILFLNIS